MVNQIRFPFQIGYKIIFMNYNDMPHIKIFTGISIEDKCRHQLHPLNEAKAAQKLLELNKDTITYSNSPDFIMAIKHLAPMYNFTVDFFLNGVNIGNDIEPIFKDFNDSYSYIENILDDQ